MCSLKVSLLAKDFLQVSQVIQGDISRSSGTKSVGGGNLLTLYGSGFSESETQIQVCDKPCNIVFGSYNNGQIQCITKTMDDLQDYSCDVVISTDGIDSCEDGDGDGGSGGDGDS